jgi:hypothetical protein
MTPDTGIRVARALVTIFCVLVALAGWSVSYATQADLAGRHHFTTWEAWAWPAIADSAALAVMLRLHLGQVRPGWPTSEAWVTFGLASGVMVIANTAAISGDWLGAAMHAILPIVPMLVWHLVIHGRPQDMDGEEDIDSHTAGMAATGRKSGSARELVERLYRRHGASLTTDMVQLRVGVSQRHASRLLGEVRRPKVVGET